jgi:uncharacterized protein YukE
MGKAYVDPTELRRFSADLKRFNNDLITLVSSLKGRLAGLGESWRDQEHKKFVEAFEASVKGMQIFVENAHQHAQFIDKKAALIEDYLKTR